MKVCIIAPTVIPLLGDKQCYGGIELVISLATEELVRRGHEVYLFASGDSRTSAKLISLCPKAIGQSISLDEERALNHKAYEMAVAKNPDVIWDHTLGIHAQTGEAFAQGDDFNYKPNIVLNPERLIDTKDIPVIQTLHGPAKDHLPGIVNNLAKAGHYCVSISHDQALRYASYVPKEQFLGTVYNAVDTKLYQPKIHQGGDYFVWLGRYGMEKGAHIALAVAHKLKTPIMVVGKLAEKHEQNYFDAFVKPNLQKCDTVVSNVAMEDKIKIFRNAKATLMTNLWPEPFGLVAIESMATGTPVIGPALGALVEIIGGSGILVPVDDLGISEQQKTVTPAQEKYVDRIIKYMPKLDSIPPHLPRDRVEKLFSVKHNVDGYEEAFAKAIYLKTKKLTDGLLEKR